MSSVSASSYPNIIQNIHDFLELSCYMRHKEGVERWCKIFGDIKQNSKIGIRVAIASLYFDVCQDDENTDENETEEEMPSIASYTSNEWSEISDQLQLLCKVLEMNKWQNSTICYNPHDFVKDLYVNWKKDSKAPKESKSTIRFTPEQTSILETSLTRVMEELCFHQCLSILRNANTFSKELENEYKKFILSSFEEDSKYKDRLKNMFEDSKSMKSLKSLEEVKELLRSNPYSLDVFRDSFGFFLSELENMFLGAPKLVKLGYTLDNQPRAVPGTFDCEFCKSSYDLLEEAEKCEKSHKLKEQSQESDTHNPITSNNPVAVRKLVQKSGMMNVPSKAKFKITFDDSQEDVLGPRQNKESRISPTKRRRYTDEEDRAIMHGCKRFKESPNMWANIRDYYAVFCDASNQRTNVNLKDRARTLTKKIPDVFFYNETTKEYELIGDFEEPTSAEALMKKAGQTETSSDDSSDTSCSV